MNPYHKIQNLYKFDEETKGRRDEFTCPEFQYLRLCEWVFTEKIDGTNIRVTFDEDGLMRIGGRTDRAQLHPDLVKAIEEMFRGKAMPGFTLYGEGYGAGIQKGGCYRPDKSFILFDVHDDTRGFFLAPHLVEDLGIGHDIPFVPTRMYGNLLDAHYTVRHGLQSAFGEFWAEGLVGRPAVPVRSITGQRIIVKIKHRDYYGKELVR